MLTFKIFSLPVWMKPAQKEKKIRKPLNIGRRAVGKKIVKDWQKYSYVKKLWGWVRKKTNPPISTIFTGDTFFEWGMTHTKFEPLTSKGCTQINDFRKNHFIWRTPSTTPPLPFWGKKLKFCMVHSLIKATILSKKKSKSGNYFSCWPLLTLFS